jgi:arsenate reductase (glutaredoxin)
VADVVVYEKRTCTTCRKLAQLLEERGIDFDRVEYHVEPLSRDELRALVAKTGARPRDLVRAREPGAQDLPLDDDEAVLEAFAQRPALLQRPIVERGERAVLARPVERALDVLG